MSNHRVLLKLENETSNGIALRDPDALVVDLDGTLAHGGMYYSADGESLKKFSPCDANGLELLRERGVLVCVMSEEDSAAVAARVAQPGLAH